MIRWLEACALAALLAAAPARAAVSSGPSSWREGLQSGLDAALARRSAPAQPGVAAIFQRFAGLNLKDPMERQIAAPWLEDLSAQSDVSLARFRRMSAPDRQRFLKSRLKLVVERAARRADQAMRTSDAAELSRLAHDDLYFLDVERQHRLARARSEIGLDEARALAQELADPPWIVSIAGALPDDSPAALALSRMDLTLARTKESYALLARHLGGWSGEFHELPPERRRGLVSQALGSAQREEIQAAREFSRQAHAGLLEEERAELAQALLSRPFLDEPSARSLRAALALRAAARQAGESLPLSLYQQAFSAAQSLTQALEMAGKDRSEQAARLRDLLAAATKADSPAEAFRKTRDLRSLALRLPAAGSRAPTELRQAQRSLLALLDSLDGTQTGEHVGAQIAGASRAAEAARRYVLGRPGERLKALARRLGTIVGRLRLRLRIFKRTPRPATVSAPASSLSRGFPAPALGLEDYRPAYAAVSNLSRALAADARRRSGLTAEELGFDLATLELAVANDNLGLARWLVSGLASSLRGALVNYLEQIERDRNLSVAQKLRRHEAAQSLRNLLRLLEEGDGKALARAGDAANAAAVTLTPPLRPFGSRQLLRNSFGAAAAIALVLTFPVLASGGATALAKCLALCVCFALLVWAVGTALTWGDSILPPRSDPDRPGVQILPKF